MAVVIIPGMALLVYLVFADLSVHGDYFEKEISEALGHDVSINGLFDLQVGKQILLTVEDVTVSNPEWTEDAEYFSADRIHLLINGRSVFGDTIEVDTFNISGVRINLQETADGRFNWEPNLTEVQTVAFEYDDNDEAALMLHHLELDDIEISYERQGETAQQLTLNSLQLDSDATMAMSVEVAGSYTADTLTLPFASSGVVRLDDQRVLISDTTIDVMGGLFALSGEVNFEGEAELDIVAEGDDLSALGDTIGVANMPGLPYSLSTKLSARPGQIALTDFQFKMGEGELDGSLSIGLDQEKPHITANVNSPLLDLRTPETAIDEDVADSQVGNEKYFSDEPLAYSWLDSANIDAEVSIASVILANDRLEDLNFDLLLEDGALTIDPFGFNSGAGGVSGKLDLRPNQGQHTLSLGLAADNIRPGAMAIEGYEADSIPPLTLEIQLSGEGTSIREIMSSANGRISGRQGEGQINMQAAGALFSDLIVSILRTLNPLSETKSFTNLECGVYEVNITDGIAAVEQFVLQTDRLTIVASGHIDLSTEELNLALRTKTREGLGVSLGGVVNSFLKVGGTMKEPSLEVDAAGSVATTGVAVATGGLSVLARGLWDRISAEVNICDIQQGETEVPAEQQ